MERALLIREAVVMAYRASEEVTALVPEGSIHGERVPGSFTYPLVYLGSPTLTPEKMSCWNGERSSFSVHYYAKGRGSNTIILLGGVLRSALDERTLELSDGSMVDVMWTGGPIFKDRQESDIWHGVHNFEAV